LEFGSSEARSKASTDADRALRWLAGLFVATGCALRLFRIEADPHYYGWWGHIFDEGRWVEQAREIVLRLKLPDELGHNAFVAPLHEVAMTVVFWFGGVSFATARLFPALCGCALVVLIWLWLRTRVDAAALVLGVAMIAFPADLVVLGRLAVPESGAMLGTTVAVLLLCTKPPTPRRMFVAGLAAAVMIGLKLTAVFLVPALLGVALALRDRRATRVERLRDASWFLAGIAVPALIVIAGASVAVYSLGIDLPSRLDRWSEFVILRTPFGIVSLPFFTIDAPVIGASCLALWLAGLAWPSSEAAGQDVSRWYRAALLWAMLWILTYSLHGYFPSYYRVHLLVPLALVAALSAARLSHTGLEPLSERLSRARPARRVAMTGFVGFVLGLQLAAISLTAATWFAADPERLSVRLTVMLISLMITTGLLYARLARPRVLAFVIAFSVTASVLHYAHWIVEPYRVEFFVVSPDAVPARLALLALAALVAKGVVTWTSNNGVRWLPAVSVACVTGLAWLIHVAPGLLAPTYTLRDFSVAIGELHPADQPIWSHRTMSAFIANPLEYRRLHPPEHRVELPPTIVTDLPLLDDEGTLEARYELVRAFSVYVPEQHSWPPPASHYCSGSGQCFGLFRLKGAAPEPASGDVD
jgi:hypothetical protein